jgi:hypothetical protein
MADPSWDRGESIISRGPKLTRLLVGFVALKVGIHLFTNFFTHYEFHRDEFLYFAMGEHFDLWRMDIPPAIAALSVMVRGTFGDSLIMIRLVPAFFGAATLLIALLIVRELGGGRFAQWLTGCCMLLNPLLLRASNLFQPVVLDQFAWALGFFALARLQRENHWRWWVLLGIGTGFGILSKLTIGIFGLAVIVGLFLMLRLSWITARGPWIALFTAVLLGLPSLVGQVTLDFPVVGYMADLQENQLALMTMGDFLVGQLEMLGPGILLAVAGTGFLLIHPSMRPFRVLGWALVATVLLFVLSDAKPYYLGPAYSLFLAAGAVWVSQITRPRLRMGLQWAALAGVTGYGVFLLPIGIPILPPAQMEIYAVRLAGEEAVRTNRGDVERIPQDYADMLGWEDQVEAVAEVFHNLPEVDRERAVILASNYGEAGAIDFYGPERGLPKAVSFVGTYWLYGPGEKPGDVAVLIGFSTEDVEGFFAEVEAVRKLGHPFAVSEERNLTIHVARQPYRTLQEIWPELQGIN